MVQFGEQFEEKTQISRSQSISKLRKRKISDKFDEIQSATFKQNQFKALQS